MTASIVSPVKRKPPTAEPQKERPAWRAVCQAHALAQALKEARKTWKVRAAADIPFNYRWEHVQAVVDLALWLANAVGADAEIVDAAAWLHDVRKGGASHAAQGAKAARRILKDTDFPAEKIEAVTDVIAKHSGLYRAVGAPPLEPMEAAVLWDADKLSKLGVQALAYNLSLRYMHGLTLPQRRENTAEYVEAVLQRTVLSMNTAPGRRLAEQRYQDMLDFLAAWAQEEAPGAEVAPSPHARMSEESIATP